MKKISALLLFIFAATLFFFTAYGKGFYPYNKTVVTTARVNGDRYGVTIPMDALRNDGFGDYVYVLRSEQVYENEVHTVLYVPVTVVGYDLEQRTATLPPNPPERDNVPRAWNGDRIVLSSSNPLINGERVLRATGDKRPIAAR
ncbi:MAG: hypothetical protein LBR76_04240 [Oscillospiraceae bacterium]|jgi:hypothetical protein|nr:hypothetical protein [Oscillospiraceae bacterium]